MPETAQAREVICAGFGRFGADTSPAEGLADLPDAPGQIAALAGSFADLGYARTTLEPDSSAEDLGHAVLEAIDRLGPSDILVVHVLSHGWITRTGALRVVAADGRHTELTAVETWLRAVVDAGPYAPLTLFLLDICFAGDAARLSWQPQFSDEDARAWVIAACGPSERAYGGRFTRAVTQVNRDLLEGVLDIDESRRYAPITTIAQRIRRAVTWEADRRLAFSQRVTASLVDISAMPSALPFFPNPRHAGHAGRRAADPYARLAPVVDQLDDGLDPAHFIGRAAAHGPVATATTTGFFRGRDRELRHLAPWANLEGDVTLRVVTGSPGAGKSALIGILVCAAHPDLHEHTRPLWEHLDHILRPCPRFAAVHAHERGPHQVIASIEHQLFGTRTADLTAPELIDRIAELDQPPVVVIDALDEAVDGEKIMEDLLLPLLRTTCADGRAVRLLVGMRPWRRFRPLVAEAERAGGLLDLDRAEPAQLREDIRQYVLQLLLTDRRWNRRDVVGPAMTVANEVATRLTGDEAHRETGAFLVAGLFAGHVLSAYDEPVADNRWALDLGATVPLSLPGLLELDLRTRECDDRVRDTLTVLAHARGDGMPAETLRRAQDPSSDVRAVLGALDEARFYLRAGPDQRDGTILYQLYHQSLADHLKPSADPGRVLDGLLSEVAPPGEDPGRRWDLASPYTLRHIAEHADQAGRLGEIVLDEGWLVAADPAVVREAMARSDDARHQAVAEIYRSALDGAEPPPAGRRLRTALALAAARAGHSAMVRRLVDLPGHEALSWRPRWSLSFGDRRCTALALGSTGSGSIVAVGEQDGSVSARDFATGKELMRVPDRHDGAVTAVAFGAAFGRTLAVSADAEGVVRILDAETGERYGRTVDVDRPPRRLIVERTAGRPTVLVVDTSGAATIIDLPTGRLLGSLTEPLMPQDAIWIDERVVCLARATTDAVVMVDGTAERSLTHDAPVTAVAVGFDEAIPLGLTGDQNGQVRVWSLLTGTELDSIHVGVPVTGLRLGDRGQVLVATAGELIALEIHIGRPVPAASATGTGLLPFRPHPAGVRTPDTADTTIAIPDGTLDDGLVVYEAVLSAWFSDRGARLTELDWAGPSDVSWRAVRHAEPRIGGFLGGSGLPQRVPMANLVPLPRAAPQPPPVRDPARMARFLTGYFHGVRRVWTLDGD
ncbi:hypothetical protein [Actinoplanes sp. NPDC048796]|uniref:hypothetical protein n=1 Tax=Actinoplanes sp. NPDC048796 TaxID=3155640 RepID=UPI0033ED9CDE